MERDAASEYLGSCLPVECPTPGSATEIGTENTFIDVCINNRNRQYPIACSAETFRFDFTDIRLSPTVADEVKEVAAMLKAIHAQEDAQVAKEKTVPT
ncbi:MAG TPA: hypothetical protein VNE63_23475 [Candidatus Acidoferrales bacterium]|nr:hypothetical protein [Candidatus Acidoferrales bacterium]